MHFWGKEVCYRHSLHKDNFTIAATSLQYVIQVLKAFPCSVAFIFLQMGLDCEVIGAQFCPSSYLYFKTESFKLKVSDNDSWHNYRLKSNTSIPLSSWIHHIPYTGTPSRPGYHLPNHPLLCHPEVSEVCLSFICTLPSQCTWSVGTL